MSEFTVYNNGIQLLNIIFAGRHTIQVYYANMEILGSPFYPDVFDASLVTFTPIKDGTVGEEVHFEVDCTRAGPGTVTVEVSGPKTRPQPRVVPSGDGKCEITFRTLEAGKHCMKVFFSGISVPGKLVE